MTRNEMRCAACNVLMPVVRRSAGKWVGGLAAAALGPRVARSWQGMLVFALVALAAGAAVDAAARPICGDCACSI